MALTIETLQCGNIRLDNSFLVQYQSPGALTYVRTNAFLIKDFNKGPLLVDTGFRGTDIMASVGMEAYVPEGGGLETELEKRGLRPKDIRFVLHTHLHIDHAGKDDLFPDQTSVIVNRRELEVACGGSAGGAYPAVDMKHLLGRVWSKNAIQFLDLEQGDVIELGAGLAVELAGGHTEGSLNVLVETADGLARICGDVVYNFNSQLVDAFEENALREPHISGNHAGSERSERAAMKRAMSGCRWLLPSHDAPAKLNQGEVVGRVVEASIPGPVISNSEFQIRHADLSPRK
ncbi:MBL fold metallo-hydrolase [Pseudorhodoplanes sp.]|uniref:MBL fold metallo-hydrolase n=1 Tax=Pseudorhodoplanes sp. TaxID=1934341 RepID=UPI003D0DE51B